MKLGPVLTNIFNLISQSDWQDEDTISHWNSFFETIDYDLILNTDPGEDELSDYEIDKLKKIFEQHGKKHYKQLVKETHRLPEWKATFKHGATESVLISIHDILRAVGREEDFDAIQDEMQEDARLDKLFSE